MSTEDTIRLEFDATLKVAGEKIHGEVLLYFPGLMKDKIEEVHVKLRGSVFTQITRSVGQTTQTRNQRVYLVRDNVSVWLHGNGVYPDPGSDVLRLPFTFELPPYLLPSCEYGSFPDKGNVQYFIQVVGQRPGIFQFNRRLLAPFPLLPPLSSGARIRTTLQQGWQGPWQTLTAEKDIRRGIWGDRSHAKMALVLPELVSWPVFTAIPFTLTITTHSKPMKADDKPSSEQIFPAPPEQPHQVDFRIERDVFIRVTYWKSNRKNNHVSYLGGLGPSGPLPAVDQEPVQVDVMDKIWIPSDGGEKDARGRWKQEVVFKSSLKLRCPPSFDSETMRVNYNLQLKVDFPGIGNALKAELPVHVVSSMYPPGQEAWDGPPPEMDLPPEYFTAEKWSEHDEKA